MAVVFTEGFDAAAGGNSLPRWLRGSTGLNASISPAGRFGGSCGNVGTNIDTFHPITVSGTRICGGFYFLASSYSTAGTFLRFNNDAVSQGGGIGIEASASGGKFYISAWHTSTAQTYVSPTTRMDDNIWHWVEFDINFANSGHAYMYVDGVLTINQPTLDLYNSGTVAIERVRITGNGVNICYLDDLILWDDTAGGLQFADFPVGPQRCETLRPTSDVSVTWTRSTGGTSYTLIDDTTYSTADYVQSQVPGQVDRYGYPSLSRTPLAITALNLATAGFNNAAGLTSVKSELHSGVTTVESATTFLDGTTRVFSLIRDLDPNTASAWTVSGVTAMEAGFELVT
jgi:hypothetical protein